MQESLLSRNFSNQEDKRDHVHIKTCCAKYYLSGHSLDNTAQKSKWELLTNSYAPRGRICKEWGSGAFPIEKSQPSCQSSVSLPFIQLSAAEFNTDRQLSYHDMCSLSLATVRQNKQGAAHKEESTHHQQPNPDPTQLTFRPNKHYPLAISAIFAGTRELIK